MTLTFGVRTSFTKRAVGAVLATALATAGLGFALAPAQAKTVRHTSFDQTTQTEAKRVDSVPTPKLGWYKCYGYAQCTTVKLPMDYDHPNGAKTEVALLRVKATDQKHRIGSLFVNPGGPGGSGTELAYVSNQFLSESVTSRFDIVGIDPRGTNFSDNVTCFANQGVQGPNSRLLSSDSWGHTAYGTSECVTGAVDNFLLRVKLPAKGTECVGDDQPFTGSDSKDFKGELNRPLVGAGGGRPVPIAPVLPRY